MGGHWSYLRRNLLKSFDLTSLGAKGVYEGVPNMTVLTVATGSASWAQDEPGSSEHDVLSFGRRCQHWMGPRQLGLGGRWIIRCSMVA